jgi:predicted enzyme related to lactoylglutathione lyase
MADDLSTDARTAFGDAAKSRLTRRVFLPVLTSAVATSALAATHLPVQAKQAVSNADAGTVWWSELYTRDPIATRAFYASVIGWTPKVVAQENTARPPVAGEKSYTMFTMRGQEVAGAEEIESDDPAGRRPGWFTYIQVDDVDEAAKRAIKSGGKVVEQPFDVPSVGRMAEIEDPEGNRIGLVSPRA